jgi:hypothetical protein
LDAKQTSKSCYTTKGVKPYTIKWLKIVTGMDDPFIKLHGSRPPTTTIHKDCGIDTIFTWNVCPIAISTLPVNTPASSNHLGLLLDIDISTLFNSKVCAATPQMRQSLTSQNVKAREKYINFLLLE